jgi:Tol biopolymer transport system component
MEVEKRSIPMAVLSLTQNRSYLYYLGALLAFALGVALLFVAPASAQDGGGTLVIQTVRGGPIYVVNGDGSDLRQLTTGIDPALSPDGQQVAFTRWDDDQDGALGSLWVISIDGSGERLVADGINQPTSPTWSPDGNRIVVSMQQGGRLDPEHKCSNALPSGPLVGDENGDYIHTKVEIQPGGLDISYCYELLPHPEWGLHLVDLVDGSSQDLPRDRFSKTPAWDPANDWHLVYSGDLGLVSLDLNQDSTWPLTDDKDDHDPAFSPDGSQIVVSYWQHDHWEIHRLNADGGGRVRLTETPLRVMVEQKLNGQEPRSWNNVSPTWSPDGSQIAFLTDRSGIWEIWTMAADGSDQRPLLPADVMAELGLDSDTSPDRVLSWR